MNNVAELIRQDLDFDMPRFFDIFLQIKIRISEGRPGLPGGDRYRFRLFFPTMGDAHTPSAAAAGSFQDYRIANVFGNFESLLR